MKDTVLPKVINLNCERVMNKQLQTVILSPALVIPSPPVILNEVKNLVFSLLRINSAKNLKKETIHGACPFVLLRASSERDSSVASLLQNDKERRVQGDNLSSLINIPFVIGLSCTKIVARNLLTHSLTHSLLSPYKKFSAKSKGVFLNNRKTPFLLEGG